jgi:hypothetical protein
MYVGTVAERCRHPILNTCCDFTIGTQLYRRFSAPAFETVMEPAYTAVRAHSEVSQLLLAVLFVGMCVFSTYKRLHSC